LLRPQYLDLQGIPLVNDGQAVTDVAHGAERQVRMVESTRETAASTAQVAQDSAQSAEEAAQMAEETRSVAQEGVAAARQATDAIRQVAQRPGARQHRRAARHPGGPLQDRRLASIV
jgi:hypothetical protein